MEPPDFVLGRQHSTNPLVTAPERAKRILLASLLGIAYAAVAYVAVLLVLVVFSWVLYQISPDAVGRVDLDFLGEHSWLALVLYVPSVFYAYRTLSWAARQSANYCEVRGTKMTVVEGTRSHRRHREVDLHAVGAVELRRPDWIVLSVAPEHDDDHGDLAEDSVVIRASRGTVEDEFERLEAHLVEHVPDAKRCLIDGEMRYTQRWGWSDLYPWQVAVRRARLELGSPDGRRWLDTGAQRLLVVPGLRIFEPGERRTLLRIVGSRTVDARGMVLALAEESTFCLTVQTGCGEVVILQKADSSVQLNGDGIGDLVLERGELRVDFKTEVPEPLAALILLHGLRLVSSVARW